MIDYKKFLTDKWSKTREYLRYRPLANKKHKTPSSLPGVWRLLKDNFKLLSRLKRPTIILVVLQMIAVYIFDSSSTNEFGGVTTLVNVIATMTYIWLARQTIQDKPELSVKSSLYRGPAQIVPFLLLIMLIGLQSLPFSIGGVIYQIGVNSSPPIAIFYWEKLLFAAGWLVLSIPTIYWLLPSLLGLVVVCIPGVKPLEARRAAQDLVSGQMFKVWLKILWLMLIYGLIIGAVVVGLVTQLPQLSVYVLTYGGVLILPLLIYQLFVVYQALRGGSGN